MSRRVAQAAEKVEGEKETLTMSLDLDLSKDQEVLLKGYSGKKESWNGTTVIILQKLEKEEKLKIKVTKTEVKSLEDDEMTVIGTPAFAPRCVRASPQRDRSRRLGTHRWSRA
jgi:mannitol-specific phosphotransferase system IIBC component